VRGVIQVVGVIAGVGAVLWVCFALSFRTKFRPVQDAIRRLNRAFTNPRVLRSAGTRGASASVVHHVGRVSGAEYQTPVVVVPAEPGLVIALPYGPGVDWVRNIFASSEAMIQHEGTPMRVVHPRLASLADVNHLFPTKEQLMHRLYGVNDFLVLSLAESA
jgi:deazaflavin-dependent oxidoreductase (nitroreductase family)